MTTPPPGEGTHELADMPQLSDVQATDALLDRLAARTPSGDDLADPIVAGLVRLAEFADAAPRPDLAVARLIEVLDGRPLYMFPRASQPSTEADEPIQLDAERPAARMIDVSDPVVAAAARSGLELKPSTEDEDAEQLTGVAARTAIPAVPSLALVRAVRAANARRLASQRMTGWQGALQQMALPAASVVIIALLGGGVSAVVTGDPMSPINGVTSIASSLPGLNGGQKKIEIVRADIVRAQRAGNDQQASVYLSHAQQHLADVPDDSRSALQKKITDVSKKIVDNPVKDSGGTIPDPGSSVTASPTSPETPIPSESASVPVSATTSDTPTSSPTTSADPSDTGTAAGAAGAAGAAHADGAPGAP